MRSAAVADSLDTAGSSSLILCTARRMQCIAALLGVRRASLPVLPHVLRVHSQAQVHNVRLCRLAAYGASKLIAHHQSVQAGQADSVGAGEAMRRALVRGRTEVFMARWAQHRRGRLCRGRGRGA